MLELRSGLKTPSGPLCKAVKRLGHPVFFEGETSSIPVAWSQDRERNPSFQTASKAPSVNIYHIDLPIAEAEGNEGDLAAVGRPDRRLVVSRVFGEAGQILAIRIHHINIKIALAVGNESEVEAVR